MLLLRRVLVGDQERVLIIRNGRFERMLGPGAHNVWAFGATIQIERHNVGELVFGGPWVNHLVKVCPDVPSEHFTVVETNDFQVAIVSLDGKVARAFGPGVRALFWRGPTEVSVSTPMRSLRSLRA